MSILGLESLLARALFIIVILYNKIGMWIVNNGIINLKSNEQSYFITKEGILQ